jgi:hypothetical protein
MACDLVGRLQVGPQRGLLDVGAARGLSGVHVDGYQGFRVIDDDGPARGQRNLPRVRRLDLVFDLEA